MTYRQRTLNRLVRAEVLIRRPMFWDAQITWNACLPCGAILFERRYRLNFTRRRALPVRDGQKTGIYLGGVEIGGFRCPDCGAEEELTGTHVLNSRTRITKETVTMPGIKIYQDFDGYYAEDDDPEAAMAAVVKVGSNREEATRNAIKRYNAPIGYLTGDGVDEKVAKEFNIPVRD